MRTLTLNNFDYDCILNFHYEVSTQKFCSIYISIRSEIFPTYLSLN